MPNERSEALDLAHNKAKETGTVQVVTIRTNHPNFPDKDVYVVREYGGPDMALEDDETIVAVIS